MSKIHKNNSTDIAQLLITHKKHRFRTSLKNNLKKCDLTYSSIDGNNVLKDTEQDKK